METTKKKVRSSLLLIAFTAALGGFLFGYDTAIISGTIGLVKEKYALDTFMEGWYVSSALVGCIIGVAFSGVFSDIFGRKPTLGLCGLLFCISAVGCALCTTHVQLITYRLIGGLGIGIASMLSPLYISEISPAKSRGRLVALYQFAITLGILAAYFVNSYILKLSMSDKTTGSDMLNFLIKEETWRAMLGSAALPALLFFGAMLFVPESPRWLVSKGKFEAAEKITLRIHGRSSGADLAGIAAAVKKEGENGWRLLLKGKTKTLLLAGILLALLSQFTGINAIIYYGPRIMEEAGLKLSDALGGQVIIGAVNVLATVIAIWKIDDYGRKNLMLAGITGMCASLLLVGLIFLTGQTQSIWFIVFILAFIASFAMGYGPVLWVLLSEIYPTKVRGRAMSIATLFVWIGTAIVGQIVPWMLEALTPVGTFFIFALCCLPVPLVLKLIPETKGLSLEEIGSQETVPGRETGIAGPAV